LIIAKLLVVRRMWTMEKVLPDFLKNKICKCSNISI